MATSPPSLLGSFNGLAAVLQNTVPPNGEQGDIAPAQPEEPPALENHPLVAPGPNVDGDSMLAVVLHVEGVDEAGPMGDAAGHLLGAQQTVFFGVASAQRDATAVGSRDGENAIATASEDPLLSIVPQLSPPGNFYLETLGKASGVALAIFRSILGIAYRALELVLPPNDETGVERAYDTQTLPGAYREDLDSEPIAFEPATMPKSVYFCH